MKKIAGFIISLLTLVTLTSAFSTSAAAISTDQVDQCDQVTTYLLPEGNEVHDSRVSVDFSDFNSNHNSIIDVIAQSGYQVTEVDITVGPTSNPTLYTYTTGDLVSFNPPGDHDIEYTQVKVKKVCVTPTPTVTVDPTVTPTPTAPPAGHGDGLSDGRSSCPECTQAPKTQGEVLGISTMAATGSFDATLMKLYIIAGMFLVLAGYVSFTKEKRYN